MYIFLFDGLFLIKPVYIQLVRRVTRQMFAVLHKHNWNPKYIDLLNTQLEKTVLKNTASIGFLMHFTDIFLEEVAKVSQRNLV